MIGGGYAAALGGDERMVNATGQSFEVFANAASIGITSWQLPAGAGKLASGGRGGGVLLRRPVVFTLCLECHNGASGFGRAGTGVPQAPLNHNLTNSRFQNCTSCHVSIHGSNADAFFLR